MLDEITERLSEYQQSHDDDEGFSINRDDFSLLQSEGILFYCRYYILFQMGDYERTVIDTNHNLKICELVERYSQLKDKEELLQYRPYILRVNVIARAINTRDSEDRNKKWGRLSKATDALCLDTTDLTVSEVCDNLERIVTSRLK